MGSVGEVEVEEERSKGGCRWSSATGGTGLGLAIVKHVLLQHKAILNINSKPNVGSTFTCVFNKELFVE